MTPADDQAAVSAAPPPFKPLAQKPPSVKVEARPDGSYIVSSNHPPAEGPKSIAQLLADRAAAHPERPYLLQREPGHGPWRGVTYGEAKQAADSIAQWLIDQGRVVRQEVLTGWWIDTGKLTPLLEANRLLLERVELRIDGDVDETSVIDGRVEVEAGAVVRNSTIRGPVSIAAGATVSDSFVGPFSAIGRNCEVRSSEVEHSVLMDGARIADIPRLEDSLIGRHVVVARTQQRPRALRLMVGDHSQIDVE